MMHIYNNSIGRWNVLGAKTFQNHYLSLMTKCFKIVFFRTISLDFLYLGEYIVE